MNVMRRCRYGLMMYNQKDIWTGRSFEVYGEFSEHEVKLFEKVIQPKQTVIDVGANVGAHTIAFSRIVGDQGGLVVSFEPVRQAFYLLCGNIAINNRHNVYAFHQAIGNKAGTIHVPEMDWENSQNCGGMSLLDPIPEKASRYPVMINTIDSITIGKCHFIKVDVEGMECEVLEGAKNTIERHKPFLYVENDREKRSDQLIKLIKSLNYTIYKHQPSLFNKDNFDGETQNVLKIGDSLVHSENLFCYPAEMEKCPVDPSEFGMQLVP